MRGRLRTPSRVAPQELKEMNQALVPAETFVFAGTGAFLYAFPAEKEEGE